MYKNTDRQASLLDVTSTMGESARRRLESSSAHAFVRDVYPILLEVETKFAQNELTAVASYVCADDHA